MPLKAFIDMMESTCFVWLSLSIPVYIHSLFFTACSLPLSLNGSSSFFSLLRYLCIDGFRTASQVNFVLLHIDRKNTIENLITIADVTICGFPLSVQRLVPRLIYSFFFGVIHLNLSNWVSIIMKMLNFEVCLDQPGNVSCNENINMKASFLAKKQEAGCDLI